MAFSSTADVEFERLGDDEKGEGVLADVLAAAKNKNLTLEEQQNLFFKLRGELQDGDGTAGLKLKFRETKKFLKILLQTAIGIELTTIPPYLMALYSIKPGVSAENDKARENIQNVVVEEMLHAGLAANILKSIGGHVEAYSNNIPDRQAYTNYPVKRFFQRQDDVESRQLKLLAANQEALDAFVAIETESIKVSVRFKGQVIRYGTISEFYEDIQDLLVHCELQARDRGETIFNARNASKQTGDQLNEYYFEYPGLQVVRDIDDALNAINTIQWQGEGSGTPPPYETDPTHAQWFIETRDMLEQQSFDIWEDQGKAADGYWASINEFYNAGYCYQLMEFELLYRTNTNEVQDGANIGIAAKQKKAYFGMGVLMSQFLRPLSVFMQKNGAYPTYDFHEFKGDPVNNGSPQEQLISIGKEAAKAAQDAGDSSTAAFVNEMVLAMSTINDGVSRPPHAAHAVKPKTLEEWKAGRSGARRALEHVQYASFNDGES